MLKNLKTTLEMIKFEHTLFALPFALLGAVVAAQGWPGWERLFWIVVAMVGARSSAMAFNRLVDWKYDAANPRTRMRALPAGLLGARYVLVFSIVSGAIFVMAAANLNPLALKLSPVALGSVLFYSYTKRFTALSHLVLGWALAIAPTGAWIAVRGAIDSAIPLLLSLAVLLWTAGFDIIYACQDELFDRQTGLHSIPARLGVARALAVARVLHLLMFLALMLVGQLAGLHWIGKIGLVVTAGLLIRQHWLVSPEDLSRLDVAFFTTNAYVSIILFVTIATDVFLLS
ncbi:MAG: 4-hydroxybenzoate octaprenyltransferase [Acidobacteria bacterium]|nr:4-hydroxybenzoate octaprenyltransferase [Acidobacteriota bacterium]